MQHGARADPDAHPPHARLLHCIGKRIHRMPGRHDVIDDSNVIAYPISVPMPDSKGITQVVASRLGAQSRLFGGRANSRDAGRLDREAQRPCDRARQFQRLIITPGRETAAMQRYRDQRLGQGRLSTPYPLGHQKTEQPGTGEVAAEFGSLDQCVDRRRIIEYRDRLVAQRPPPSTLRTQLPAHEWCCAGDAGIRLPGEFGTTAGTEPAILTPGVAQQAIWG